MQTCSRCNSLSPDSVKNCRNCQVELTEFSTTAVALRRLRANPRVKDIRLVVAYDCCPACREIEGTYAKEGVPSLPIDGCSGPHGCRCFYEPMLNDIYP